MVIVYLLLQLIVTFILIKCILPEQGLLGIWSVFMTHHGEVRMLDGIWE